MNKIELSETAQKLFSEMMEMNRNVCDQKSEILEKYFQKLDNIESIKVLTEVHIRECATAIEMLKGSIDEAIPKHQEAAKDFILEALNQCLLDIWNKTPDKEKGVRVKVKFEIQ